MNKHISKELKKTYLDRRLAEVEELRINIFEEDYDAIFSIGHRLKGNGSTFGFPDISKLGLTLELAALEKDKDKLQEIADEIKSIINEGLELL